MAWVLIFPSFMTRNKSNKVGAIKWVDVVSGGIGGDKSAPNRGITATALRQGTEFA
jgi:hypothetical protein